MVVQILNSDLIQISMFSLCEEEFGEAERVKLGWGKKETQFHGTEGKGAAKTVSRVEEGMAQYDDGEIRIIY